MDGKVVQDFTKVISGVSGIEERFGLMLHEVGRHKGFYAGEGGGGAVREPGQGFRLLSPQGMPRRWAAMPT